MTEQNYDELSSSAQEIMPMIRERLAAGQRVRGVTFQGVSMLPMLRQGKDSVELAELPEKLRKYDLPVYIGSGGKYSLPDCRSFPARRRQSARP